MFEAQDHETTSIITSHSYPFTFKIVALILFFGVIYFFIFFFPKYYQLNLLLKHAEHNLLWGNYHEALKDYKNILLSLKNCKHVKIKVVQIYFILKKNYKAINILEEIRLNLSDNDWKMLTPYMTKELESYLRRQ